MKEPTEKDKKAEKLYREEFIQEYSGFEQHRMPPVQPGEILNVK